jgi:HSP20 family protein
MTLPSRWRGYPARWNPWVGFDDLFEQMSRMLSSALSDVGRVSVNSWSPPVDIHEIEDAFQVEADMPGVRSEDVNVELHGQELRISGEYGTGEEDTGQRARRSGRFDYRLTLPGEVTTEGCTADLENGVLRLRLPKTPAAARQRIPVQDRGAGAIEPGSSTQAGQSQQSQEADS